MKVLVYDAGCDADPGDSMADPPRPAAKASPACTIEMWAIDATEAVANGKGRYSLSPPADKEAPAIPLKSEAKAEKSKS